LKSQEEGFENEGRVIEIDDWRVDREGAVWK
jgi:hypothetical protein